MKMRFDKMENYLPFSQMFLVFYFLCFCSSVSVNSTESDFSIVNNTLGVALEENDTSSPKNIVNENMNNKGTNKTVITDKKNKTAILTAEDIGVKNDWGGNCTAVDWKRCSKLKTWLGDYYKDIKKPNKTKVLKSDVIDCKVQPNICMKNGWTVTRCQILCMGKCNRELQSKYDKYVKKDGMC